MRITSGVLNEFVRRIYRICDEQDLNRDYYLDGLADVALDALNKGKTLVSSSGNGTTAGYETFSGYDPTTLLELMDRARGIISSDTLAEALSASKPVRHFSSDFGGIAK